MEDSQLVSQEMEQKDIMSEELISKVLAEMEDQRALDALQEENDLFLALQLQEQEYKIQNYYSSIPINGRRANEKVSTSTRYEVYWNDYRKREIDANVYDDKEYYVKGGKQKNSGRVPGAVYYDNPKSPSKSPQGNSSKKTKKAQKVEINIPTTEGIDGNTRMALYKLQNQDILAKIGGIVSQGKESFIYHIVGGGNELVSPGAEYVAKIFKTTKLEFKDREQYIDGEWRFRYDKLDKFNTQKSMKLWAEKEIRNLKRLKRHNIPCPVPILQKGHILILSFLGKNGWPSPQLAQVNLSSTEFQKLYWECCNIMRNMYQKSGLVHADLSPYNILLHKGVLHIIDIAQGVMTDHTNATFFLRRDCLNITNFFKSRRIEQIMKVRNLYEFITNDTEETAENYFNKSENEPQGEKSYSDVLEEQAWLKVTIPASLKDLNAVEDDASFLSPASNFLVPESTH